MLCEKTQEKTASPAKKPEIAPALHVHGLLHDAARETGRRCDRAVALLHCDGLRIIADAKTVCVRAAGIQSVAAHCDGERLIVSNVD